mmetsp:Transcript_7193/g.10710  ORF Transcript_7193/g.10710 Transcript_7193/m.10710 type:complete len:89 (-) Transcript_7193:177-443(-)
MRTLMRSSRRRLLKLWTCRGISVPIVMVRCTTSASDSVVRCELVAKSVRPVPRGRIVARIDEFKQLTVGGNPMQAGEVAIILFYSVPS